MDKKLPKAKKKDKQWQAKIVKNLEKEKMELDHPKGKERFLKVLRKVSKKK